MNIESASTLIFWILVAGMAAASMAVAASVWIVIGGGWGFALGVGAGAATARGLIAAFVYYF